MVRKRKRKRKKLHLFKRGAPYARKYGGLAFERGRKVLPEIEVEISTTSAKFANSLIGLAKKQGAKYEVDLETT